jgi:curved DNA-binding protein CbpA
MSEKHKRDYYEVLGVPRDVGMDDLTKAYHKLAQKVHPDHNPNRVEAATEDFKELVEAFVILRDPEKRRLYNELGFASDFIRQEGRKARQNAQSLHEMFMYMWESRLQGVNWESKWGVESDRIRKIARERSGKAYPGLNLVESGVGVSITMVASDGKACVMEADYDDPLKNKYLWNNGVKMFFSPDVDGKALAASAEKHLGSLGFKKAGKPSGNVLLEMEKEGLTATLNPLKSGRMAVRLEGGQDYSVRKSTICIQGGPEKKTSDKSLFPQGSFRLMPLYEGDLPDTGKQPTGGNPVVLNDGELKRLKDAFFSIAADVLPDVQRVWIFPHGGLHDLDLLHPSPEQLSWLYGKPVNREEADVVPFRDYYFHKRTEQYTEETRCNVNLGRKGRRVFIDPYLTEKVFVMSKPITVDEARERILHGEWGKIPRIEAPKAKLKMLEPETPRLEAPKKTRLLPPPDVNK